MNNWIALSLRWSPWIAAALFAAAVVAFGTALDGYSQALHPVSLLGAKGFPGALAFNVLGFMLPGALAALAAVGLRAVMPADVPWPLRIGASVLMLAALAFAGMGLLPLDTTDLESQAARLHGTAWVLWCVAFAASGLLLGFGWLRTGDRRATWTFAAAAGFVLAAFFLPMLIPPGIAQRLAFLAWWAWLIAVGRKGVLNPAFS